MKYVITLKTGAKLNPGNLPHIIAVLENPANRNSITLEEVYE